MNLVKACAQAFIALVCTNFPAQSFAASSGPVTVTFEVNISQAHDYVVGHSVPIDPIHSIGSFTFSTENSHVNDYGTTTIVEFFGSTWPMGTSWSSPVTPLIPQDPSSGAYGPFYNSYTFPNVSDYPSTFIEQVGAQSNTYLQNGNEYSAYHIELRATRRSGPKSGIGLDDYAFNRDSTAAFLQDFVGKSGQDVYFNESYQVYSLVGGLPVYQAGRSYSDYAVRILSVSAVPEASTSLMFLCGLIILTFRSYGKNTAFSFLPRGAQPIYRDSPLSQQ